MAVKNISTLMGNLKVLYDKSKDKSSWRVLQGMNREYCDTFIVGDNNLWQVKSEEVSAGEFIAVGVRISRLDEEIEKIIRTGSPVPFGTLTPRSRKLPIIMAGVQMYSSDSSNLLCREYLSSRQASLEQKLREQVDKMMDDDVFRKRYVEHKERIRKAYL